MTKTLRLFGRDIITVPRCYGLPTFVATLASALLWLVIWSYHASPVRFVKVTVEQAGPRSEYVTLKITKLVDWSRLCPGIAEQEIRPLIAVDNPTKVSSPPIKLDSHVINTPKRKGPNGLPGDPPPVRYLVVPSGTLVAGMWQYKVTARIACWPWEYIWPIDASSAVAEFKVE